MTVEIFVLLVFVVMPIVAWVGGVALANYFGDFK